MANTTTAQARIDPELKEKVERILEELEMTTSDAIKLFISKSN